MKGGGYGVVVHIIVGILGGIAGGRLFGMLHISMGGGLIGGIIVAFVGAVILVWIARLLSAISAWGNSVGCGAVSVSGQVPLRSRRALEL
jgi:uncharacterized membrane protein YeaQ/YmgE (transglycosylase-associated protein family)